MAHNIDEARQRAEIEQATEQNFQAIKKLEKPLLLGLIGAFIVAGALTVKSPESSAPKTAHASTETVSHHPTAAL